MMFFYDSQIRRYLIQLIRAFSDISVQNGPDENGTVTQKKVPIVYGDPSWQVAQLLKGGNENTAMPSPMMALWIANLEMSPDRRRDTMHESQVSAVERNYETSTGYGTEVGNRYTIERYMPVPYMLTVQLDIWTTTTTTKLQILEQIMSIYNPMVQLQQNSNKFDWTAIFEMELVQITWSNRSIPNGTEQDRDIASLQFKVPIWINPPAKVKKMKIIEQIVTNVYQSESIPENDQLKMINDPIACIGTQINQIIVTPGNFRISIGVDGYNKNEILLLNKHGVADPELSWKSLFAVYGNIKEDETLIRLKLDKDIEIDDSDILGYVQLDASRPNVLLFTIDEDTLPSTTLKAVTNIIDPHFDFPGGTLPVAVAGQRYLLVSDLVNNEEGIIPNKPSGPWGSISANENDIIEYNGINWIVSFNSNNASAKHYVINLSTLNHYKFENNDWIFTYLGEYFPGYWRLENIHDNAGFTEDANGGESGSGSTFPVCGIQSCAPKSSGSV